MICPPDVRLARPEDEPALMAMLEARHQEDGIGTFSIAKSRMAIKKGLMRDYGYIGVIRNAKTIEASIGLFVTTPWDSEDPILTDSWAYVRPEFRRSTNAKNLIEFAKWASTQLGVPLFMTKVKNEQTSGMTRLYARQLPECGSLFLYDPNAPVIPLERTARVM
jgi:hypothetical protein